MKVMKKKQTPRYKTHVPRPYKRKPLTGKEYIEMLNTGWGEEYCHAQRRKSDN